MRTSSYDQIMTTTLDALAVLLIALALGAALFTAELRWLAPAASGVVIYAGMRVGELLRSRSRAGG